MLLSIIVPVTNYDNVYKFIESIDTIIDYEVILVGNVCKQDLEKVIQNVVYIQNNSINRFDDFIELSLKEATGKYIYIADENSVVNKHALDNVATLKYNISIIYTRYNIINSFADIPLNINFNNVFIKREHLESLYKKQKQVFYDYYNADIIPSFIISRIVDNDKIELVKGIDVCNKKSNFNIWLQCIIENRQDPNLIACIVFRNEGVEVENTIKSIKYTTFKTAILLVDDASDDGYDYKKLAKAYNCLYKRFDTRVGSVGAKDWAGRNVPTDYFVLLDGHMRLYKKNWDDDVVTLLRGCYNSIITARTHVINKDNKLINEETDTPLAYAARVCFNRKNESIFDAKWTYKTINENGKYSDVSCVLGAFYATSKDWWKEIDGLNGLNVYGLEETFMSVKTWLLGGKCIIDKELIAGHFYRSKNPNICLSKDIEASRLFIAYLFDIDLEDFKSYLKDKIGTSLYDSAYEIFCKRKQEYDKIKEEFTSKQKRNLNWFKININNKVK